jgi:hypothetical protein
MQHGNDFGRFINLPYLECPHARALAPSLAANTGVASLVLTSNNMRDSGLSAIAAALQGNLALRKLRIVNTQVELRIVNTQAAVTATRLTRPPAPCNSRAPCRSKPRAPSRWRRWPFGRRSRICTCATTSWATPAF